MAANGLTHREIALQLGITIRTVEYHTAALNRKIRSNRIAVKTAYALSRGLACNMFGPPALHWTPKDPIIAIVNRNGRDSYFLLAGTKRASPKPVRVIRF